MCVRAWVEGREAAAGAAGTVSRTPITRSCDVTVMAALYSVVRDQSGRYHCRVPAASPASGPGLQRSTSVCEVPRTRVEKRTGEARRQQGRERWRGWGILVDFLARTVLEPTKPTQMITKYVMVIARVSYPWMRAATPASLASSQRLQAVGRRGVVGLSNC
jgi:hypothetical protein